MTVKFTEECDTLWRHCEGYTVMGRIGRFHELFQVNVSWMNQPLFEYLLEYNLSKNLQNR
jgi:hypothetical protein